LKQEKSSNGLSSKLVGMKTANTILTSSSNQKTIAVKKAGPRSSQIKTTIQ